MLIQPGAEEVVAGESRENAQLQTEEHLVNRVGTIIDTLQAEQNDA